MKVIRTVHAHEAITFGDPGEDDYLRVDAAGVVVADARAKELEDRADELGVAVEVEDAPGDAKTGDLAGPPVVVVPGAAVTGHPSGIVTGNGGPADDDPED